MEKPIKISVAYALPDEGFWQDMAVPAGTTARDAIDNSGVLERFKELDLEALNIGIYAMPAKLDQVLKEGDRIEIYRDLLVDPKTVPRKVRSKAKTKVG